MEFIVDAAHPCLSGHFPGRPLVPGVLILDHVLDAIEAAQGAVGRLRLPQVKFMQPLLPGMAATIELDVLDVADGHTPRWRFRVRDGDRLLASGDVVAVP